MSTSSASAPRQVALPALLSIGLGATLVVVTHWQPGPPAPERPNLSPVLEIVTKGGPITTATAGQPVGLMLGAGMYQYGAIFAVEASGSVVLVWPGDAPGLQVTPDIYRYLFDWSPPAGDWRLVCFLSWRPQTVASVERRLRAAVDQAKARGRSPLAFVLPLDDHEAEASARLSVK